MNFNSEKIGFKNSYDLYRKNMPHFLRFMTKKDVKRFDWFKNYKSSCELEFLKPIFSELKFITLERTYGDFSIFKQ